jgi:SAM-dependent methyltransferase
VSWAYDQTNCALQSEHDVSRAYVEMIPDALPYHNERWKNWDAAIAVSHARSTPPDGAILDAGACRDPKYPSPFLPALQKLGYQRLFGVNLDERGVEYENGICYRRGDITRDLPFAGAYFDFVACLSVIEHGVDWRLFLTEMARVIKPDGQLFVSFDYWEDKIDTGDRMAFGAPVHIFDSDEVDEMRLFADDVGLESDEFDPMCDQRVVKWLGLEYTFANLLFTRT